MDVTGTLYLGGFAGVGNFNQTGGSLTVSSVLSVAANGSSLNVDGAITAANVSIGSTGLLGGDGTITLTGGNLNLDADAKFVFSLTETLTANGGSVIFGGLDITDLIGLDSSVANGTYTLIDGTSTFIFANVANFGAENAFNLGSGKSAYFQEGSLQVVVVPEPSTWALLGVSMAGGLIMFRRRKLVA